jgi:hypothetical protein
MRGPGSDWLTRSGLITTFVALHAPGCFLTHERAGTVPATDAGAVRDAASLDAQPPSDAAVPPGEPEVRVCEDALAAIASGLEPSDVSCAFATSEPCSLAVSECCTATLACEAGRLRHYLSCDDSCDQRCSRYPRDTCALASCEWLLGDACGEGPPGSIAGPGCIERRGAPCTRDAECMLGQHCASFWINPCRGLPCDACGGEERRCAY